MRKKGLRARNFLLLIAFFTGILQQKLFKHDTNQ